MPRAARPSSRPGTRRVAEMLYVLTSSDLQVRYGRGGLRVLKWLLDPIAALGVYLVLVALVLDRGGEATGLSLACAVVPFQFLVTAVVAGLSAVIVRGSIIANMSFPRLLIPVSTAATEAIASSASLILLPAMMLVYGVEPTAAVLWLPVALAVTVALACALAFPATLLGIWYPEYQGLMVSVVRTGFFLAPGLVALDQITGTTRELLPINPLTGLFESFRDALLYGTSPEAWQLLVPLAAAAVVLALALPVFRREQADLPKLVG